MKIAETYQGFHNITACILLTKASRTNLRFKRTRSGIIWC